MCFMPCRKGGHCIAPNDPSIADGGTTKKLTSKYKQNDNKKRNSKG